MFMESFLPIVGYILSLKPIVKVVLSFAVVLVIRLYTSRHNISNGRLVSLLGGVLVCIFLFLSAPPPPPPGPPIPPQPPAPDDSNPSIPNPNGGECELITEVSSDIYAEEIAQNAKKNFCKNLSVLGVPSSRISIKITKVICESAGIDGNGMEKQGITCSWEVSIGNQTIKGRTKVLHLVDPLNRMTKNADWTKISEKILKTVEDQLKGER